MILITGASGLLGANFVLVALHRAENVLATYYQHPIHFSGARCVRVDLTNHRDTDELVYSTMPTWIVHCAALTDVDWCEQHPDETWLVNHDVTRNLAIAARHVNSRFIFISTDSVFDGERGDYAEIDQPRPLNVYSRSKLAAEKAVQEHVEHRLIVRTNIYGWNVQDKFSIAEWMLGRLEDSQTLPAFQDVLFTPILVNDLSEIVLAMMKRKLAGLYHVAGSQACTKYEFAAALANVFGFDPTLIKAVSIAGSSLVAARPRKTSLQTVKACSALGRPMPDLRSGLTRFRALRDCGSVARLKALGGSAHGGDLCRPPPN